MEQIKAQRVTSYEGLGDGDGFVPGRYFVFENGPLFVLPCGHAFRPEGKWEMRDVENPDKVTLSPSIACSPSVPCWHGYLTDGVFRGV